jgi:DNA polymerase-3 subunit delta'
MRFAEVIGQTIIKERMIHGVQVGRIPHAQLILGAEGSGNLALAMAYVQYILCNHRTETDSCGDCSSCKKVSGLVHPDVHFSFPFPKKTGEMEVCSDVYPQWRMALQEDAYLNYEDWMQQLNAENKQGNIPTKELRNIIKNISLKSFEGKMKVCVIWLPEYLGQEGNIILKSLEEPPENTLFLLVGSDLDAILGTILSRTQLVRVAPIDDASLTQALVERDGISQEDAQRLPGIWVKRLAIRIWMLGEIG